MPTRDVFRNVDGRVLFVSQTAKMEAPYLDPSVRYRCYNPAEVFEQEGVIADVVAQQKLTAKLTENYDAFVFHRPYGGDPNLAVCLDAIRRRGCKVVADYDDLIFAPEYALESSIFLNGVRNEVQTKGIFKNNQIGFAQFDSFSVSTEPLKRQVLKLNPCAEVTVAGNGLSQSLLDSYDMTPPCVAPKASLKLVSYLSGTASHNRDFESVAEVLAEFLCANADFRLAIAGPLEIPAAFPKSKIVRIPHREYRDFFASVGIARFNIAPLKLPNVFNECKSGLKFFESGIWGVPSVVSPLEDFRRFGDSDGIAIAEKRGDWLEALNRYADFDCRKSAAEGLAEYCRENCMARKQALKLLAVLKGGAR